MLTIEKIKFWMYKTSHVLMVKKQPYLGSPHRIGSVLTTSIFLLGLVLASICLASFFSTPPELDYPDVACRSLLDA